MSKPNTTLIDALTARTRFGEIMEKAENEQTRFVVSRRGKAKVVIMGIEEYLKSVLKQPKLLATIQLSSKKAGLNKLSRNEIEAEIKAYRKTKKKK